MNIVFNVPPALIVGALVSTILPLLVGLVTTRVTAPGWRAVLLALLASATGLLTELLVAINAGVAYDIGNGGVLAILSFLVAVGLHFGLWKPTTLSAKAQDVLVTAKGTDGTYRVEDAH